MDTTGKVLDLLFRRIPPERILKLICRVMTDMGAAFTREDRKSLFLRFAEVTLHGYSPDELENLFSLMEGYASRFFKKERYAQTDYIFAILLQFADETLTVQDDEPVCRISRALQWREVYHMLGQDTAVCAYLAYAELDRNSPRADFAWPATLQTDDGVFQGMLADGIAENHRHLNGSTQGFDLSWCVLMNKPIAIKKITNALKSHMMPSFGRGADDNIMDDEKRLLLAALLRTILFRLLHKREFKNSDAQDGCFHGQTAFQQEYLQVFFSPERLINIIEPLRKGCGADVPLPIGKTACLDYALERPLFHSVADRHYRVLAGERALLYRCFSACFRGEFSEFDQILFYLYLLLKNAFRAELIQQNQQVGFQNFSDYEQRKDVLWDSEAHLWEAYRMSINAPLDMQAVKTLESRVTPADDRRKTLKKVMKYDMAKFYADLQRPPREWWIKHPFLPEQEPGRYRAEPHFYVMHFVKRPDRPPDKLPDMVLRCRHEELRASVKKQAMALAGALSASPYLCGRIRGIDACNNEVVCRPEVFATAFRFLRGFRTEDFAAPNSLLTAPAKRLSVTYHAGEDFYDIPDGLRAIDEAVQFLDFRRGDRLGHALALGVDPCLHYHSKSCAIILPKQNHLDNLVWLLYRCRELNFDIPPQLYGIMKQKAYQLMMEIYGSAIAEHHWAVTLDEYYYSMMLRGEAPEQYKTMRFVPYTPFTASLYERYAAQAGHKHLDVYRKDERIAGLYYYYQYGVREKEEGSRIIQRRVSSEYMDMVRRAQDALQRFIEKRGYIIECNPTSNVLIGTFGQYAQHPIFRFNNAGLEASEEERKRSTRLHVCVNTDDLGIFDTSLEFEYALLYQALKAQTDTDGKKKYQSSDILLYLQNIRDMGRTAVFPLPK